MVITFTPLPPSLPPSQPWLSAALHMLDQLCKSENSPPFLQPVDTDQFPVSESVSS